MVGLLAGANFTLVTYAEKSTPEQTPTQVNLADPADLAIVHGPTDQLVMEEDANGSFAPSGNRDMEEVLAMRARYQQIGE